MEWGLERISSHEISEWMALAQIEADEAEERRHKLESRDGQVVVTGLDNEDDEDEDDDGEAE